MFTINYQYWSLQFVEEGDTPELANSIEMSDVDFDKCFRALTEDEQNVVVRCNKRYMRRLVDYMADRYIFIKAAGGVVRNNDGELLMMTRNGRADLPKGKVEDGETLACAALRETSEETGLQFLELGQMLMKSYHIYNLYGGWHFKQTTWFEMHTMVKQPLVPQLEEQITEVKWLEKNVWRQCLNNSYATMRQLADKVLDKT